MKVLWYYVRDYAVFMLAIALSAKIGTDIGFVLSARSTPPPATPLSTTPIDAGPFVKSITEPTMANFPWVDIGRKTVVWPVSILGEDVPSALRKCRSWSRGMAGVTVDGEKLSLGEIMGAAVPLLEQRPDIRWDRLLTVTYCDGDLFFRASNGWELQVQTWSTGEVRCTTYFGGDDCSEDEQEAYWFKAK